MFPVKHRSGETYDGSGVAWRAARWAGIPLDGEQRRILYRYVVWLGSEAVTAGGIGPRETDRLWTRHIGDAFTFGRDLSHTPGGRILDVGTGVGLPGIPLAIALPDLTFALLDRSRRRVDLLERAVSILDLENVVVREEDVRSVDDRFDGVTFRASLPVAEALDLAPALLVPGGVAIVGLTHARSPEVDTLTRAEHVDLLEVPAEVLDSPSWLLRMIAD